MATGPQRARVPRIPVLDGFRVYAILAVVLLHLLGMSGALRGDDGEALTIAVWGIAGNVLDVFFILSGFLLFVPIVARGGLGDLRSYAIGRAARLLPAYWLALAITFVVAVWVVGYETPPPFDTIAHTTTLQMPARLLDPEMQIGFGVNGALWMISIIAGLYVVLPLVARWYLRHPLAGLALAMGITLGWRLAVTGRPDVFASIAGGSAESWLVQLIAIDQLPGWFFSFALGMTGAWAYMRWHPKLGRESTRRWALGIAAIAFAGCVACAYAYGRVAAEVNAPLSGSLARQDALLGLGYSAARALLMAAIVAGPLWMHRPFGLAPVRRLSDVSYGLYLIHMPVGFAIGDRLLGLTTDGSLPAIALWVTVVISVSLVYAALSHRLLELPALGWARRRIARGRDAKPVPYVRSRAHA